MSWLLWTRVGTWTKQKTPKARERKSCLFTSLNDLLNKQTSANKGSCCLSTVIGCAAKRRSCWWKGSWCTCLMDCVCQSPLGKSPGIGKVPGYFNWSQHVIYYCRRVICSWDVFNLWWSLDFYCNDSSWVAELSLVSVSFFFLVCFLCYARACVKWMLCGLSWAKYLLCGCKELNAVTGWSFPVLSPFWDSEGLYICYVYVCYIYPVILREKKVPAEH